MKRGPHAALAALLNGSQVQKETLREKERKRERTKESKKESVREPKNKAPSLPYRCCRHFIDELCIDRVNQTFIHFIPSFIHSFIAARRKRKRFVQFFIFLLLLQVPFRSFRYYTNYFQKSSSSSSSSSVCPRPFGNLLFEPNDDIACHSLRR